MMNLRMMNLRKKELANPRIDHILAVLAYSETEYSDLHFRSEYIRIFGQPTEYISWVKATIERVVQPIFMTFGA